MTSNGTNSRSETIYCIHCGEEIPAETNFCPECGSERDTETGERAEDDTSRTEDEDTGLRHRLPGISKENSTRRNVMSGVGYTFGGLVVLGTLGGDNDNSSTGGSGGNAGGDDSSGGEEKYPNAWYVDENTEIILRNVEGNVGEFSVTIRGDAVNKSGQDYSYVQLQFGLYGESGAKTGDALANTSGLDAGQTWRFEAMGTETSNVESFSVESITAY